LNKRSINMSPKTKVESDSIRAKSAANIASSALKLFSKVGYSQTTIRMISKDANVSLGLLYNYFKSKEDLLLHILQDVSDDLDAVFLEFDDPKTQFKSTIEDFIKMLIRNKEKIGLLTQLGIVGKKFQNIQELTLKKHFESVYRISQNLRALGFADNSEIEARMVVATLDGMALEYLLMGKSIQLTQLKDQLIKRYCN